VKRASSLLAFGFFSVGADIGCPAHAETVAMTATPALLDPSDPGRSTIAGLSLVAGFELSSDARDWGGFSGMLLSDDGRRLTAVSDIGRWLTLELRRDASGAVAGIGAADLRPLLNEEGAPFVDKEWSDAEALTRAKNNALVVAFERQHRLWRYESADGDPRAAAALPVAAPDGVSELPENGGLEAALWLPDDRLLLLSEDGKDENGDRRAWIGRGNDWIAFGLVPTGIFQPTDVVQLPDGRILLLERSYTEATGPAARLSVFGLGSIEPGARVRTDELAVLAPPLTVDNFEALAVEPAPDGAVFVHLLSDDNQNEAQRTLLLQFRLRL
jgi:hypothetical protein